MLLTSQLPIRLHMRLLCRVQYCILVYTCGEMLPVQHKHRHTHTHALLYVRERHRFPLASYDHLQRKNRNFLYPAVEGKINNASGRDCLFGFYGAVNREAYFMALTDLLVTAGGQCWRIIAWPSKCDPCFTPAA